MPISDSVHAVENMRQDGLEDADVIAVALLEVAAALRDGLRTQYSSGTNALELIAMMLGADPGGGSDGKSITGAINRLANYVGESIESLASAASDMASMQQES